MTRCPKCDADISESYEPDDPSVGIVGGYYCDACDLAVGEDDYDDYTDDRRHVDCARCKRTRQFRFYDASRYDVDVWNQEGDVVRWFRRVTGDEVESIRKEFDDNPSVSVVVTDAAPGGH